jgi:electron transfer flavoprotein beta subunit
MNLLVLMKRVPATQEEELRIVGDGAEVDLSRVPFKVNDWDTYAIEEAVKTVELTGGAVTAISMGDAESDEVLRRSIAMGAKDGFLIETERVIHDPVSRAGLICNFLKKESLPYDAIFTGVQSEDDQFAAVGGILAAKLGLPYASMVIGIDEFSADHVIARRELEGGLQERIKVALPAVLSIQSGINEPRYVSIMGVRKASKVERKVFKAAAYQDDVKSMIDIVKWIYPPKKGGAAMLGGDLETICNDLLGILKEKGVYQ